MTDKKHKWEHIKTITDGERFDINGLNIWDHDWKYTGDTIQIKDPLYGQDYTFTIYEITRDHTNVKFATGEFSNGVWGIYLEANKT